MSDTPTPRTDREEVERLQEILATARRDYAELETELAEAKAHAYRLFDLVRYARSELHEAGLLSDREYADLADDGVSLERLERYTQLRARVEELERDRDLQAVLYEQERDRAAGLRECLDDARGERNRLRTALNAVLGIAQKGGYNPGHRGLLKQVKGKCMEALNK
ncbi:hypothetical protein [Cerasicoccus frondis]|uniref:hypothetical protein n=1 Tax=Cerasicoccus frondis TaxID=490090 RepID=UPI0028528146|nr:hypothetical protein [Cerasicoccus frondis]